MSAILEIIKDVFWLVIRWFKIKDDPQNQYSKDKSDNESAVIGGDVGAVNRKLDADLDRLPDSGGGDSK